MKTAVFKIWRGDANGGDFSEYTTEISEGMVVLDAVHDIQAKQANDLACRWNCKAGKCGSCSAEINGMPKLMCMTRMDAIPLDKPITMEVKGRNLIEGVPKTITIEDSEIREALSECIATIINAIRVALERTPPELSADISDRGIVLTGGGALIKNLDKRIREETGLPVSIADDPLASVVLGTGKMLSDFKLLRKISID